MEGLNKTPDEIKEGLGYCGSVVQHHIGCAICPYWDIERGCRSGLMLSDALSYIHQLEAEREALLTALRKADTMCEYCKHGDMMRDTCDGDCSFCYQSEPCQCRECDNDSHWEWAGIKEDNQ